MSQRLTVRLDELEEWVENEAEERDRSMAYIVRECVEIVARGDAPEASETQADTQYATQDQLDALRGDMNKLKSMLDDTTDGGAPPAATEGRSDDATPGVEAPKTGLHDPDSAVEWAVDNEPVSRADIVESCYDESVATVNSDTWYETRVRPLLKETELEFVRNRGWELPDDT